MRDRADADDRLAAAAAAIRGADAEADGAATRLRVRRSLEARARGRRQLVSFVAASGVLLGGTLSWALATGRAGAVWRAIVDPATVAPPRARSAAIAPAQSPEDPRSLPPPPAAPAPPTAPAPPPLPTAPAPPPPPAVPVTRATPATPATLAGEPAEVARPAPRRADPVAAEPPPVGSHGLADRPSAPPAARGATAEPPRPAPAAARPSADEIEALYRRAHELHFRTTDRVAALAAWDAYLAAEPRGRFVAEARYNRALLLVRLGRWDEASAALAPFARGEVEGGYRRAESAQLVERLRARGTGAP